MALGAGININMPQKLLDRVDQPATSLMVETGKEHEREDLIKTLDKFFIEDYHLYKRDGFKPFLYELRCTSYPQKECPLPSNKIVIQFQELSTP